MVHKQLIILSYHRFTDKYDEYVFSRTYDQFWHDIRKKTYDWITMDDGMSCNFKACEMMREVNQRAKLFVCTSLIGKPGYLTWEQLDKLSKHHNIECHSHNHVDHTKLEPPEIMESIEECATALEVRGYKPRYFVAPYNLYNDSVEACARLCNLMPLIDRITIKNNTI
jgi:peptidoglycan/xylan/chitin deacetylase (PgdA/CDA1 family)